MNPARPNSLVFSIPCEMPRARTWATAKALAQYALAEQDSKGASIASLVVAVYSFVSTAADVSIWTSLPKDFQIARFKMPENGKLKITPPGSIPIDIGIPACNNAIVYVRITTKQAQPVCEVITF